VNFDPIYSWPKPVTKPYPPLYLGGGPASFRRMARLNAGWISMTPSTDVLSRQLEELRGIAEHDVPVINIHMGELTAKDVEGYRHLGVEQLLVELETQPRDATLRRLDELQTQFASFG
jgi:alkanesulfonate monooxygenase SsuD/methylene tetrahydromethanopterin reductase-like flavin-dependent oxidoreductase (luciferase family)